MKPFPYEPFPVDCTDEEALFRTPRDEALRIFDAFYQQITWRVVQLMLLVRSTGDGAGWPGDFSPASLDSLMQWIAPRIRLLSGSRVTLVPGSVEFTTQPVARPVHIRRGLDPHFDSILVDMSIYFAECYRRAEPGFYWRCIKRKCAQINSPSLVGPVLGFILTPWINMGTVCMQMLEGRTSVSRPRAILEQHLTLPRDPKWASKKRS